MTTATRHPIHRVTGFAFERTGPWTLRVSFDDATEQMIDFASVLAGALFAPLRDPALFAQVRLDHDAHTLFWPNGADFDPATLHDWPQLKDAMVERARTWGEVPPGTKSDGIFLV